MKNKRTEIAIETARVIVISGRRRMLAWCAECNKEVNWLTVEEAALLASGSSRDVVEMVEAGELHSSETREGILIVCTNSILKEMTI
ncbi:MAG TPA: hypothetical protein VNS63_16475 [Blastocatellia bacterium]|nr:hypothetical protein [Blastocatellia bacterium]